MAKTTSLEIHQINVGQGDSTLIIVRDCAKLRAAMVESHWTDEQETVARGLDAIDLLPYSLELNRRAAEAAQAGRPDAGSKWRVPMSSSVEKALLIDGGNDCYGFNVRDYCARVGAIDLGTADEPKISQPNFGVLVTHYHDDHQDGLRCVMRDLDPDGGKPVERVRPAYFLRLDPFKQRDGAIGNTGMMMAEIESQTVKMTGTDRLEKTEVRYIPRGGKAENGQCVIVLGNGAGGNPIRIRVVASERCVFKGASVAIEDVKPKARKGRQKDKAKNRVDENDRSISVVVEYGSFRHFIGGDTGGKEGLAYADIEAALGPALAGTLPKVAKFMQDKFAQPGHCCSFKLNHHGTKFSNDAHFLATLRPRLVVAPAGVKAYFHGHPTKETVARLTAENWSAGDGVPDVRNTIGQIVATEIASKGKGKAFDPDRDRRIKIFGDIVIRPIDEDILNARMAKELGQKLRVQVFGNGEQTPLPADSTCALRATAEASPAGSYYPLVPFEVTCELH